MAVIDFATLSGNFDIYTRLLDYDETYNALSYGWAYESIADNYVQLTGSNLEYASGVPAAGTITTFSFWFPGNDGYSDINLAGLPSLDFSLFAPLINGGLTNEQATNFLWRTVLAGDDTILLGNGTYDIMFAGDGRFVESGQSLFGGDNSISGSSGFNGLISGGSVAGDYCAVNTGALAFGGNDTIEATGYSFYGDAITVDGFLQGGNDVLASDGTNYLLGDASDNSGTVIGGNDTIDATNVEVATSGDIYFTMSGLLVGGANSITAGGTTGRYLVGDADQVTGGIAQGGNDTIVGSGGGDTIHGDFASVTGGTVHGGHDLLFGYGGNDTIYGNGGNDTLGGGTGTDELHGEDGNDEFRFDNAGELAGNETLDGGNGVDTIHLFNQGAAYSYDLSGVTLTSIEAIRFDGALVGATSAQLKASQFGTGLLSLEAAIVGDINGFGTDGLTVIMDQASLDLSNLVFTAFNGPGEFVTIDGSMENGADVTGTDVADLVIGGGYDDTLRGGDGNDTLRGGFGRDSISGGKGNDVIQVSQGEWNDDINGGDNTDTLDLSGLTTEGSIVDLLNNTWTKDFTLAIFEVENVTGGGAADNITGDGGANSIRGGGGNDTFKGGAGNDTIDGGADVDTADYSDKTQKVSVTLNGAVDATVSVNNVAEDSIRNIEIIIGGSGHDNFTGDSLANTFYGNVGNDTFKGGAGNDTIDGGGNFDTADYSEKTQAVRVTLNGSTPATVFVNNVAEDSIKGIENITGGSGHDSIVGDGAANTFYGNIGNDTFIGGAGNDTMDGGGNFDTADYSEKTQKVSVTLNGSTAVTVSVNNVAEDTIRGIENIIGGSGHDSFTGDSLANTFYGNIGNDVFIGGAGNDTMDGGGNFDTADYSEKTLAVRVALNGSTPVTVFVNNVAEDSIKGIENITGGSGHDNFTGDTLANTFFGNVGNDTFKGGAGNDTMDGGGNIDTADYSDKTQAVSVTLNGSTAVTVFVNGVAEDSIKGIEYLIGGSAGDSLTGDTLANRLSGGLGNDTLTGAAGADEFRFDTALGATNIDTIADFVVGTDKIQLDDAIFAAIVAVGAGLETGEFRKGAGVTTAADANDYIIYNTTDGKLYYDASGAGGAAAVHFATLTTKPGLLFTDFVIV